MDRGAWWATVHEVANNPTQLSARTHTRVYAHVLLTVSKTEAEVDLLTQDHACCK